MGCMQGGGTLGGGILPNLLFFKRKIVRLGSKMANLEAYKKNRKKMVTFLLFFLETVYILWGRQKNQQGGTKW